MKKKWIIKTVILAVVIPIIGSTACRAQVTKPAKKTTKVTTQRTANVKINSSKVKAATPAVIRPKQNKHAKMQVKHNNVFRMKPHKPVKMEVKHNNVFRMKPGSAPVKDSTHGFGRVHPGAIYPASSKTGKGARSSINPQPLPPGSNTPMRNKAARKMINPQPLPPGSRKPVSNKTSRRMINPQPLPPKAKENVHNKAAR